MMMKLAKIGTVAMLLALASCASRKATLENLNAYYEGKSTSLFFFNHGQPSRRMQLSDRSWVYRWDSEQTGVSMPTTTQTTGYSYAPGFYSGQSVTTGGGYAVMSCVLKIMADQQNRIQEIDVTEDTLGAWGLSRFAEVFSEYNKKGS